MMVSMKIIFSFPGESSLLKRILIKLALITEIMQSPSLKKETESGRKSEINM